jgi:hypothetical protein
MPSPPRPSDDDPDALKKRASAWAEALKTCEFAGQIDLSEDNLKSLAPEVRAGFESHVPTLQTHAVRIVFSVNCVYYASDEGYWEYFCRLLDHEKTPQVETRFGRQIEESLTRFGFLEKPRYGPFRCVGPLLEQVGVSRRSIPHFAAILRDCGSNGWDSVKVLSFPRFCEKVEAHQHGTYLGYFLKSDTKRGYDFTRQVALNLQQFESGLLSWQELQTVPGRRPGFWKELQTHLCIESSGPRPSPAPTPPPPYLFFDHQKAQIQLLFSHEWVERRAYVLDEEVVENSVYPRCKLHLLAG